MFRLIVIIALAYGAYWCYNNVDFNTIMNNAVNSVQNEKTILKVNQGRAQRDADIQRALENQ